MTTWPPVFRHSSNLIPGCLGERGLRLFGNCQFARSPLPLAGEFIFGDIDLRDVFVVNGIHGEATSMAPVD